MTKKNVRKRYILQHFTYLLKKNAATVNSMKWPGKAYKELLLKVVAGELRIENINLPSHTN